jgi:hypothetical protein
MVDDNPARNNWSNPGRTALNQHIYRHHGRKMIGGSLQERLAKHDDFHFDATLEGKDLGHTHAPWDAAGPMEEYKDIAKRYLAEGTAAAEAAQAQQESE